MADRQTVDVYEHNAIEWIQAREPTNAEGAAWATQHRVDGPIIDLGCGPGWHLTETAPPAIALDASRAMLQACATSIPHVPSVQASVDALPLGFETCGAAIASRIHLHLAADEVPMALADLHRALKPGAPVFAELLSLEALKQANLGATTADDVATVRSDGRFAGRLFSAWGEQQLRDVLEGAGFGIENWQLRGTSFLVRLRRLVTLPDTVSAGMRMLICGLNPSIYSAEVGVGFGRPGNRFWPAAIAAGLTSVDRDPRQALSQDSIGMTDLVKRATRKAAELSSEEYASGLARLDRIVAWLQPEVVCFVGLAGWRASLDRRAVAGWQDDDVGGRPVYLMPSTSGLNAHSQLADLTEHLRRAAGPKS